MAEQRRVLELVDDWAPAGIAVGVTSAHDTLASHGPVDEVRPLASVTKLLTAYATLIATQDGLLHLDEPVIGHDEDPATVRHLLSHAGGLPPDPGGPSVPPGTRRIYSNHGFEVLADVVEARTGLPFARHLELEVLEPLGMEQTHLEGSPAHAGRGTVTDLLRFARELLNPRLLSRQLLTEATSVAFPGLDGVLPGYGRQSPNDWGLGFELRGRKDPHWTGNTLAPSAFGHFGQSGSFVWVDPTLGLGTASLADREFGDWAIDGWPTLSDAIVEAYA